MSNKPKFNPRSSSTAHGNALSSTPPTFPYVGPTSGVPVPLGISKGPKGHFPTTRTVYGEDTKHQAPSPFGQHVPTTSTSKVPLYYGKDADAPGGWSSEYIDQLLQTMVQVGLLNPKLYRPGQWDDNAKAAFSGLLGQANREGRSYGELLDDQVALAKQGLLGPKTTARKNPPLTIEHTSPTDIKTAAQTSAATLLGRKLGDDELSPFIAGYQAKETFNQTQAYNEQYDPAGGYGKGGSAETAHPDVSAFVDDEIKNKYKTEVSGNAIGQNGLAFLKLLQQGGGPGGLAGYQT